MSNQIKASHEPLIHVTKRDAMVWWKSWLIRIVAVIAAMMVGTAFTWILTGVSPIEIVKTMFEGSFGTERKIWIFLKDSAMLLGISLAVTPAFKMRFWNTGAEGQVLIGALASVTCMFYLGDKLSNVVTLLIMLAASIVAGAIWAGVAGFFKAKWNTNETLFTLMMNYVAMQLVAFCIMKWVPSGSMVLSPLNSTTQTGWLPSVFGQKYLLNIAIVLVITVIMFVYLKFSKHGYEISVVGESENTARYIGINVKKVILRTVIISGALCGIMGWLYVAGLDHSIETGTVGGNGFTAIMVSWLAKFHPLFMVVASLLICFLQIGSGALASNPSLKLNSSLGDIITGIIILFIIGSEFFIRYKVNFRKKHKEEANKNA
ncbi:MAG: ABC transporter permease [Clostridia bacterium]|nr:ABC transporter permease [Clostridia bacterium]